MLAGGCGAGGGTPTSTRAATSTRAVVVAPAHTAACTYLLARLRRATLALTTSSSLVAHSTNRRMLTRRIAIEQVQLGRAAALVASGPTPPELAADVRGLAAALRGFSRDFARAKRLAAAGDVGGASAAMGDRPVVGRIVRASRAIETGCG